MHWLGSSLQFIGQTNLDRKQEMAGSQHQQIDSKIQQKFIQENIQIKIEKSDHKCNIQYNT